MKTSNTEAEHLQMIKVHLANMQSFKIGRLRNMRTLEFSAYQIAEYMKKQKTSDS